MPETMVGHLQILVEGTLLGGHFARIGRPIGHRLGSGRGGGLLRLLLGLRLRLLTIDLGWLLLLLLLLLGFHDDKMMVTVVDDQWQGDRVAAGITEFGWRCDGCDDPLEPPTRMRRPVKLIQLITRRR